MQRSYLLLRCELIQNICPQSHDRMQKSYLQRTPYGRVRNPILRSIPGRKKCDPRLARALRDRCIMSPPPPLTPHFNVVVSFIVTPRSAVALRRHCSTQLNIEMGGEGGAGVGHMAFRSKTIRVALFSPRYGSNSNSSSNSNSK